MKWEKYHYIMTISLVFLLVGTFYPVFAYGNNEKNQADIPEVDGIYDVTGHPSMKVRVFVHREKAPGKPAPSSSLQCPTDDTGSDAQDLGAGWVIPAGTWKYRVNPTVPSTISPNLGTIINNSFAVWENALPTGSGVTLAYDGPTSANRAVYDRQNIIAWGRTSGSALGVTYIWYQNGIAIELDTIMNEKFSWGWANQSTNPLCAYSNVYDAQNILTHELGHWFGLNDHYTADYVNNTMYGYGSKGEVKKDTLTAGDIAGINLIY